MNQLKQYAWRQQLCDDRRDRRFIRPPVFDGSAWLAIEIDRHLRIVTDRGVNGRTPGLRTEHSLGFGFEKRIDFVVRPCWHCPCASGFPDDIAFPHATRVGTTETRRGAAALKDVVGEHRVCGAKATGAAGLEVI